jgi:hypothetical protein
MDIAPPNCKPFTIKWVKTCGAGFLPHPGLMVDIVEKNVKKRLVTNGLVMYKKPKQGSKLFDIVSRHYPIHSDKIVLEFYTEITPYLKKVFELDAGKNMNYYSELIKNASNFEVKVPFISYDETLGEIAKTGDFAVGGVVNSQTKRILELELKCTGKEDMFVNLILTLSNERKNSLGILFQRVCTSGWGRGAPGSGGFGLFSWIFGLIAGLIGFVFSFRFLVLLGFCYAVYYYVQKEKLVSFWNDF